LGLAFVAAFWTSLSCAWSLGRCSVFFLSRRGVLFVPSVLAASGTRAVLAAEGLAAEGAFKLAG